MRVNSGNQRPRIDFQIHQILNKADPSQFKFGEKLLNFNAELFDRTSYRTRIFSEVIVDYVTSGKNIALNDLFQIMEIYD